VFTLAEADEYSRSQLRRLRIPAPNSGALIVTLILIVYGLCFAFSGQLDTPEKMADTGVIPPDSVYYVQRADEISIDDLASAQLIAGAMNWLSLPLAFGFFQDLGGFGPIAFLLINGICLYVWLSGATTVFRLPEPYRSLAPMLSVVAAPFLLGWMLAPNKELPTGAMLVLILRQAQRGHTGRVLAFSIFAALFKFQILVAALIYVLGLRLRYRRSLALIGISLVLPVLLPLVDALSMNTFLDVQDNQINSAAFFTTLDQINSLPFGFVLVAPIRLAANIFDGLIPIRLLTYTQPFDLVATSTSFALGSLGLLCLLKATNEGEFRRQMHRTTNDKYFLFCIALAFNLVPYLQVRYYWWAIPLMICYLLSKPSAPTGHLNVRP
jgi:hypothetical protein